jgi:hypothetical protein
MCHFEFRDKSCEYIFKKITTQFLLQSGSFSLVWNTCLMPPNPHTTAQFFASASSLINLVVVAEVKVHMCDLLDGTSRHLNIEPISTIDTIYQQLPSVSSNKILSLDKYKLLTDSLLHAVSFIELNST